MVACRVARQKKVKKADKLSGEWDSPGPGVYALPLTVFSEKKARRILKKRAPRLLEEVERVLRGVQVRVPQTENH